MLLLLRQLQWALQEWHRRPHTATLAAVAELRVIEPEPAFGAPTDKGTLQALTRKVPLPEPPRMQALRGNSNERDGQRWEEAVDTTQRRAHQAL